MLRCVGLTLIWDPSSKSNLLCSGVDCRCGLENALYPRKQGVLFPHAPLLQYAKLGFLLLVLLLLVVVLMLLLDSFSSREQRALVLFTQAARIITPASVSCLPIRATLVEAAGLSPPRRVFLSVFGLQEEHSLSQSFSLCCYFLSRSFGS